jgi:lysozyme family protein
MKHIVLLIVILISTAFTFVEYDNDIYSFPESEVIVKEKVVEDTAFVVWFKLVSKWEGGIGERAKVEDPSGLTNHGITYYYWKTAAHKIVGKKPTREGLMSLTWGEAKFIAKSFWLTYELNKIEDPSIRLMVAEACWISGPATGLRSLGYKNINHLNQDKNITVEILYFTRLTWLQRLSNWEHNKYGWKKRLNDDLNMAKKLIQNK